MRLRGPIPRLPLALGALTALGLVLPGIPGALALYPAFGIVPGLALAEALPLAAGAIARWALALAIGPLVATTASWALVNVGLAVPVAARVVMGGAGALWLALRWRRAGAGLADPPEEGARFAATLAAIAGALIAGVMLLKPWIRVRGDAWVHAGIVWQILERGLPPEDPRFAGLPLQYVWFYDFFVGLLCTLRGGDPFVFMGITNAATMTATLLVAWMLGRRLWDATGARGSALLTALGFNAGMWLIVPLRLARAVIRGGRGGPDAASVLASLHLDKAEVIFSLIAPRSLMVSFLDKFLHGTSLAYAYLLMSLWLWTWTEWFGAARRAALVWAAAAAAGMLLFHGVVGLSAIPAGLGALLLAALVHRGAPWLPTPRAIVAMAAATLAGALAATPYTLAISRGWPAAKSGLRHSYFALDAAMIWTMISATVIVLWVARRPIARAFRERRAAAVLFVLFAAAMAAFTVVVSLPLHNSTKFVYQVFVPIAALGGAGLAGEAAAWARRLGRAGAAALLAIVFLGTPVITIAAYLADSDGRASPQLHPDPADQALDVWIRSETPPDAVFVDAGFRDLLMVQARRQLLLGSSSGPERAAFPLARVFERRRVMSDLYGALAEPERDAGVLARLGRPAYVVVRAEDRPPGTAPVALERRGDLFRRVYDHDGLMVYRVTWAGGREGR